MGSVVFGFLTAFHKFFADPVAICGFIHPDAVDIVLVAVNDIVGSELQSHVGGQVGHHVIDPETVHDEESVRGQSGPPEDKHRAFYTLLCPCLRVLVKLVDDDIAGTI